jgi:hypothetical protein
MSEIYVVRKLDATFPEFYAGYEGGVDGGPVWISKRMPQARFEAQFAELIVSQLKQLGQAVEAQVVEWKNGRIVPLKSISDSEMDQPHRGHDHE